MVPGVRDGRGVETRMDLRTYNVMSATSFSLIRFPELLNTTKRRLRPRRAALA
jgi:hypothetical protein